MNFESASEVKLSVGGRRRTDFEHELHPFIPPSIERVLLGKFVVVAVDHGRPIDRPCVMVV